MSRAKPRSPRQRTARSSAFVGARVDVEFGALSGLCDRGVYPVTSAFVAGVDYVGKDGLLRLHQDCRSLVIRQGDDAIDQLSNLMRTRASQTYGNEKHDVPRVVAAAIVSHPKGVDHLIRLLPDASGHIYRLAIIETLWHIAEGFPVPHSVLDIPYEPYAITERFGDLARRSCAT